MSHIGMKQKNSGKQRSVSFGYDSKNSVFSPEIQHNVTVTTTTRTKIVNGKQCVEFMFEQKQENSVLKGSAWLEATSGIPAEITFEPDPLPKHVKSMITTIRYTYTPEGNLYMDEMEVDASGGFLFFTKHFRSLLKFSEYWKK